MNNEQTIYINTPANVGRQIKAGTPIICFEGYRLPYRTKAQRQAIREFIQLCKRTNVAEAIASGKGVEVGIPPYVLKFIS
jgi:hypothetical protein